MYLRYDPKHKDTNDLHEVHYLEFNCDCGVSFESKASNQSDFRRYCNSVYGAALVHIQKKHPQFIGPSVITKLFDNMGLRKYLVDDYIEQINKSRASKESFQTLVSGPVQQQN